MAGVGHTGGCGCVGADDDEIDRALLGEPGDCRCVGHLDRDVLRDTGGAGVARCHDDGNLGRVTPARPRERVLATPGSDDEYPPYSHSIVDGGLLEMS